MEGNEAYDEVCNENNIGVNWEGCRVDWEGCCLGGMLESYWRYIGVIGSDPTMENSSNTFKCKTIFKKPNTNTNTKPE